MDFATKHFFCGCLPYGQNCKKNRQHCWKLSKLSKMSKLVLTIKSFQNCLKLSKLLKLLKIVKIIRHPIRHPIRHLIRHPTERLKREHVHFHRVLTNEPVQIMFGWQMRGSAIRLWETLETRPRRPFLYNPLLTKQCLYHLIFIYLPPVHVTLG